MLGLGARTCVRACVRVHCSVPVVEQTFVWQRLLTYWMWGPLVLPPLMLLLHLLLLLLLSTVKCIVGFLSDTWRSLSTWNSGAWVMTDAVSHGSRLWKNDSSSDLQVS